MMLQHIGERAAARRIEAAVHEVLRRGEVKTDDLGGNASTDEFTTAVVEMLDAVPAAG